MPYGAALQTMRLVARALHAAHERGIVHRAPARAGAPVTTLSGSAAALGADPDARRRSKLIAAAGIAVAVAAVAVVVVIASTGRKDPDGAIAVAPADAGLEGLHLDASEDAVLNRNPSADQRAKVLKLIERIRSQLQAE